MGVLKDILHIKSSTSTSKLRSVKLYFLLNFISPHILPHCPVLYLTGSLAFYLEMLCRLKKSHGTHFRSSKLVFWFPSWPFSHISSEYSVDSSIIGNSVKIHVKTIMVEDDGSSDNVLFLASFHFDSQSHFKVHDLPLSMLKHRKVDHIDIAFDTLTSTWGPWNGGELNVRDFQSQKMKPVRGPLRPGWRVRFFLALFPLPPSPP